VLGLAADLCRACRLQDIPAAVAQALASAPATFAGQLSAAGFAAQASLEGLAAGERISNAIDYVSGGMFASAMVMTHQRNKKAQVGRQGKCVLAACGPLPAQLLLLAVCRVQALRSLAGNMHFAQSPRVQARCALRLAAG
jgi:hypothetical protein